MITKSTLQSHKTVFLLFFFLITVIVNAQIGIGTVTPDATSVLDITSTNKGMLAPRMTTIQRNAIATPAQGLLVYDTDLKSFYYYSTPSGWLPLLSSAVGRTNFKRVKSAADLAPELAAGGSVYLLDTFTLYEINGTITLTAPINLNNAYVSGLDTNEDILTFPGGTIFQGNTGGSIRNVTLKGAGTAFNINGPATNSLLVQNTVIQGMTTSVGTISGLGLYFGNIIQFVSNANGITYSNIGNLLLSNQAWFSSNSLTFETFTGTFGLIQKNSGFSTVDASDLALDVNGIVTVGTATLLGTVFSGTTSNSAGYVRGYPAASTYTGYNFSNAWTVDAPGIPREADSEATGDINLIASVGSSITTQLSNTGTLSRKKITGTTTSNNLFRFAKDLDNKIVYKGTKPRYFQVIASVSYQTNTDATLIIYIAKNGAVLTETKVYGRGSGGFLSTSPIIALPSVGTVQMKTDDYLEVWVERYAGTADMSTVSLNLTAR